MAREDLRNEQVYDQTRTEERLWQAQKQLGLTRRGLIQAMAGAGAVLATCTPKTSTPPAAAPAPAPAP